MNQESKIISSGIAGGQVFDKKIAGNILNLAWVRSLQKPSGCSDLLASMVLAEINYRFRCAHASAKSVTVSELHFCYSAAANKLNLSISQISRAVNKLEKAGFVNKQVRKLSIAGKPSGSAVYLSANLVLLNKGLEAASSCLLIPNILYKTIVGEGRRPDLLAIMLYAEILYWNRDSKFRDYKYGKKNHKEWRVNYAQLSDKFGFSKQQLRRALVRLEELNLIRRKTSILSVVGSKNNTLQIELLATTIFCLKNTDKMSSIALDSRHIKNDTTPLQNCSLYISNKEYTNNIIASSCFDMGVKKKEERDEKEGAEQREQREEKEEKRIILNSFLPLTSELVGKVNKIAGKGYGLEYYQEVISKFMELNPEQLLTEDLLIKRLAAWSKRELRDELKVQKDYGLIDLEDYKKARKLEKQEKQERLKDLKEKEKQEISPAEITELKRFKEVRNKLEEHRKQVKETETDDGESQNLEKVLLLDSIIDMIRGEDALTVLNFIDMAASEVCKEITKDNKMLVTAKLKIRNDIEKDTDKLDWVKQQLEFVIYEKYKYFDREVFITS